MVSYFEQVQNDTNFYWEEDEIDSKLHKKITSSAEDVYKTASKYGSCLRSGAFIIAMERIFNAMRDRGEV
jgi:glutamate dehydrogenase (NAD(P)+)